MGEAGFCTDSKKSAIPRVQQHNQLWFPSEYSALHCFLATTCSHVFWIYLWLCEISRQNEEAEKGGEFSRASATS
jgi:hypothetical protein